MQGCEGAGPEREDEADKGEKRQPENRGAFIGKSKCVHDRERDARARVPGLQPVIYGLAGSGDYRPAQ